MIIVQPGDRLIMPVDQRVTDKQVEYLRSGLAELMPGVEVFMVTGLDSPVVYRPGRVNGRGETS